MKFTIDWSYPSSDGRPKNYQQKYYLYATAKYSYVQSPSFCAGIYISNLINACKIGNSGNGNGEHDDGYNSYLESDAFSSWRRIIGDRYPRQARFLYERFFDERNNNRFLEQRRETIVNYILHDSMAFPAFCIYSNIKTMLKDAGYSLVNDDWRGWSDCSRTVLGEQIINKLENKDNKSELAYREIIQAVINKYVTDYNHLLMSVIGDKGVEFYNSLRACLEKYNDDDHKLIEQYLSTENRGKRCFATFIRQMDGKKYVAFSGSLDAQNSKILRWLNRSEQVDFADVANEICDTLYAELVPLNLNTRKYYIIDYNTAVVGQDMSINDLINNGIDKAIVGEYSCCERKIFGKFHDNTPDGTLYVKLPICERCSLGLKYQLRNGANIILRDGLM